MIWTKVILRPAQTALLALLLLFGSAVSAQSVPELSVKDAAKRLANGGYILMMRHSRTVPGTGDPPGFKLKKCDTQRNLSEAGRQQAIALGRAFAEANIPLAEVRHSQWCRCRDTAWLAFGKAIPVTDLKALNSTFAGQGDPAAQQAALKEQAAALTTGTNVMWVTHQVIVSGATGLWTSQGDVLATQLVDGEFVVRFRIPVSD
ncbi:MAG: histidine phosphatase family protein [Burkholderiaceae bacterium]